MRNRAANDELRLGDSQLNAAMNGEDRLRPGGGNAHGDSEEQKSL
jgi:hypothetical protein